MQTEYSTSEESEDGAVMFEIQPVEPITCQTAYIHFDQICRYIEVNTSDT